MNIQEAKKIDLVTLLKKQGKAPHHYKPENVAWYFSPFREENTTSFKVDVYKNTWYDFGIGSGGDTVNFIMELYKTDIRGALKILGENRLLLHNISRIPVQYQGKAYSSQIKVNEVLPITDQQLLKYLETRCIPINLAFNYCVEIHYGCHSKNYKAIGFKNDLGGYELRSAYFKGKSCDAMSTISVSGSGGLNLFEGFFDFLSALTYHKIIRPQNSAIILNSANKTADGKLDKLRPILSEFKQINCYFDNDEVSRAGQKAVKAVSTIHPNVFDCSGLYAGFKDFNEFIQNQYLHT
jgi:hypothetical protein